MDSLFVRAQEEGMRLDRFLKERMPDFSRSYFQELIAKNLVLVNQEVVKKRTLLKEGDEVEVEFTLDEEGTLLPEKMALAILYEDDHLIAINKPAGLVVHPGCNNPCGTLVNGLLYHIKELQSQEGLRPGIVHRLDKDTTGVIICAKTRQMQEKLVALFAERKMKKVYLAITVGTPSSTKIQTLIGRHPKRRQEMAVVREKGKEAITELEVVKACEQLSVVRLYPKTGRTHQLRVHLKYVGAPILGDLVYGSSSANSRYKVKRQLLHAESLTFTHPATKKELTITAPLPEDMVTILHKEISQKE